MLTFLILPDEQMNLSKKKQEIEDFNYSIKFNIKTAREEHRRQKRVELVTSDKFLPCPSIQAIAKQWEDADAEVENVEGGICMTIVLPNLKKLNVKVEKKNKIEIDASRTIFAGKVKHKW